MSRPITVFQVKNTPLISRGRFTKISGVRTPEIAKEIMGSRIMGLNDGVPVNPLTHLVITPPDNFYCPYPRLTIEKTKVGKRLYRYLEQLSRRLKNRRLADKFNRVWILIEARRDQINPTSYR